MTSAQDPLTYSPVSLKTGAPATRDLAAGLPTGADPMSAAEVTVRSPADSIAEEEETPESQQPPPPDPPEPESPPRSPTSPTAGQVSEALLDTRSLSDVLGRGWRQLGRWCLLTWLFSEVVTFSVFVVNAVR